MSQAARTERPRSAPAAVPAPADEHRPPYRVAFAAAAAVFAFYAFTLAPTTAFWDTSEYIATAHILGIPHPPGNPLFVLLARAWELLLAPTGLATAVRVNLFSAFMSAGTAFFWYLTVHRVLAFFDDRESVRRVGAFVSVVVSATAYTVWNQSNVNEKVYTVSMFTIAALTWLAFVWRDHVEEHRGTRSDSRFHDDNVLVLMVFILALSVGNHLMAFLAAPALIALIILVRPRSLANWRLYAYGAVFGLIGISVHLFLSTRAGLHPVINEASPTCESFGSALLAVISLGKVHLPGVCENLYDALAREQYAKPPLTDRQAPFSAQMLTYLQYFDWQWGRSVAGVQGYFAFQRVLVTLVAVLIGGYGALEHWRRDRKSFAYLAILFGTLSVGLVIYMNFKYGFGQVRAMGMSGELSEVRERDYFFLVSFSMWGLWIGIGLTALWIALADALEKRRNALMLATPVLLLGLAPAVLNWPYASRRGDYAARDFAYNLLQSVEPYGVLFTNGDNDTFPLWYVQEVEGVRRDVTVIVLSYLNTDWYPKQLRDLTRPCPQPGAALADPTVIICQRPYEEQGGPAFYRGARAPTRSIFNMSDAEIDAFAHGQGMMVPQDAIFTARDIRVPIPAGKYLYPADQFLLSIVKNAWGDRPIYFASTTNVQYELGFYPFVARQGMAFKLVNPNETRGMMQMPGGAQYSPMLGAYMDADRSAALLTQVFQLHNLLDHAHWPDDATRNIPVHYYYTYLAQAAVEEMRGNAAAAERFEAMGQRFDALSKR